MKLRVVLDTNGYLSAIVYKGVLASLLTAALQKQFYLLISATILSEIEQKLREKFNRTDAEIDRTQQDICELALLVTPAEVIRACRDPKDDHILECAVAGQADVIVTGDKDLLVLQVFRGIRILTPRQFMDELTATEMSRHLR